MVHISHLQSLVIPWVLLIPPQVQPKSKWFDSAPFWPPPPTPPPNWGYWQKNNTGRLEPWGLTPHPFTDEWYPFHIPSTTYSFTSINMNKSQNHNVFLTFSQPQNASVLPFDPFYWPKWHISLPFNILQQVKSLLFHIHIQLYLKPEKAPISSGRASSYAWAIKGSTPLGFCHPAHCCEAFWLGYEQNLT